MPPLLISGLIAVLKMRRIAGYFALGFLVAVTFLQGSSRGQGLALNGIGPVNQSMGGAAVASPIDAPGALHWNPASISGLKDRQTSIGTTLALTSQELYSRVGPFEGTERGEPGVSPVPYAAFVDRDEDSCWTYGIGIFGVAGFRSNYPASAAHPVLGRPPGAGRLNGEIQMLQMVPTLSYACSDRLSIGFSPTLSMARLTSDPLFFAAPDDANGDMNPTYPSGSGTRYAWGGGFQAGIYYIASDAWRFGASFKSKQWFERFRFKTEDELNRPRTVSLEFEYPTIVSIGTAYSGFENVLVAVDARYFGYGDAAGLDRSGFNADGSVAGLGWDNIFAVATGAQVRLTERAYFRLGYTFNESPISDAQASANAGTPVIMQHIFNVGGSYHIRPHWSLDFAYAHGFENSISGPLVTPAGTVPDSEVRSTLSLDGMSFGLTIRH